MTKISCFILLLSLQFSIENSVNRDKPVQNRNLETRIKYSQFHNNKKRAREKETSLNIFKKISLPQIYDCCFFVLFGTGTLFIRLFCKFTKHSEWAAYRCLIIVLEKYSIICTAENFPKDESSTMLNTGLKKAI